MTVLFDGAVITVAAVNTVPVKTMPWRRCCEHCAVHVNTAWLCWTVLWSLCDGVVDSAVMTVLWRQYCDHGAVIITVLWSLCRDGSGMNTVLCMWTLCCDVSAVNTVLWSLCDGVVDSAVMTVLWWQCCRHWSLWRLCCANGRRPCVGCDHCAVATLWRRYCDNCAVTAVSTWVRRVLFPAPRQGRRPVTTVLWRHCDYRTVTTVLWPLCQPGCVACCFLPIVNKRARSPHNSRCCSTGPPARKDTRTSRSETCRTAQMPWHQSVAHLASTVARALDLHGHIHCRHQAWVTPVSSTTSVNSPVTVSPRLIAARRYYLSVGCVGVPRRPILHTKSIRRICVTAHS